MSSSAGDAYYIRPGHNAHVDEDAEFVEFTAADQTPASTPSSWRPEGTSQTRSLLEYPDALPHGPVPAAVPNSERDRPRRRGRSAGSTHPGLKRDGCYGQQLDLIAPSAVTWTVPYVCPSRRRALAHTDADLRQLGDGLALSRR